MADMFEGADAFNADLFKWETETVTNTCIADMFEGADAFNTDLSKWETEAVTNMVRVDMFEGAYGGGDRCGKTKRQVIY